MSPEDAEELRLLDATVERIRKNIPEAPYVLTAPCAEPRYHHHSRQEAESWCRNTPFHPQEEQLQYMSFLYREHGKSAFVLRSEADLERERRDKAARLNGAISGTSTPLQSSGVKKKITLSAYKEKQASGAIAKPISGQDGVVKEQKHFDSGRVNSKEPSVAETKPPAPHRQERPLEEGTDVKSSSSQPQHDTAPPSKKARISPSPGKPTLDTLNAPDVAPFKLPPRLSPTLLIPPQGIPPHDLPLKLSPDLPQKIEKELTKLATNHKRTISDSSSSSEKKSRTSSSSISVNAVSSSAKDQKVDATPKGTARIVKRSAATSPPDTKPNLKRTASVSTDKAAKVAGEVVTKRESHPPETNKSIEKKPSLVVKLKYGRKHRKEVERYLKLPPSSQSKKKLQDAEAKKEKDRQKTQPLNRFKTPTAANIESSDSKPKITLGKRPLPEDEPQSSALPNKRPRAPSSLDSEKRPRTPGAASQTQPSPSLKAQPITQKATPKKDLRAVALTRTASAEGHNSITPHRSGSTPLTSRNQPTSAPMSGRAHDAQVWNTHSRRWNELARKIKHDAQALTSAASSSPADRKKAVVMGLECILAYMLAYYAADYALHLQGRPGNMDGNWCTLLPLWRYYGTACAAYRHLDGLRFHLGTVICARINAIIADRITRAQQSQSQSQQDSPSVAASHAGPAQPQAQQQPSEPLPSLATIAQVTADLLYFALMATDRLGLDVLINQYPRTWAGREARRRDSLGGGGAANGLLRGWEPLAPGEVAGEYDLPIGLVTTPVMAVRAGLAFLREWMDQNGVEYELQLRL